MRILHVEVSNFRKLESVRVDFSEQTTLLVGANNSGKTSAMLALRYFLVEGDRALFSINDFTLSHWPAINAIGDTWREQQANSPDVPSIEDWTEVLPALDIWLHVENGEFHYVSNIIPRLDWSGGQLGLRLRLEPKDLREMQQEYMEAVADLLRMKDAATGREHEPGFPLKLWPENLAAFLERKLKTHFSIRAYALDPKNCEIPRNGVARPQRLPLGAEPIEGNPLFGLIRIDEISAQRGFGNRAESNVGADDGPRRDRRRLSDQLRQYYINHLDPFDTPEPADLEALLAIENAQRVFNERLEASFTPALSEVGGLGYPGVTDPKLKISTQIRPTSGLKHDAAVQYEVDVVDGSTRVPALRLPEDYNGLGYQNLISMIFRLMSFRDHWMCVGKKGKAAPSQRAIEPLHLVLVEEPEAHLHAQVQQVFIKKAYQVLRAHKDLGTGTELTTQLVVSTHSSHVAHESPFSCLRYFRRLPAGMASTVPVSAVVNLSDVFGEGKQTDRFVVRYLGARHCDLFFADAAILVEGPAERMFIPHFIVKHYHFLNCCYITMLEIGGSHAHRLAPLIEHLGLPTLVITDLDPSIPVGGKATHAERGRDQVTKNPTLKSWGPRINDVDSLLDAKPKQKVLEHDQLSAVRFAYQTPVTVPLSPGKEAEALASTFEEALVFENLDFFENLSGFGLAAKLSDAVKANRDPVSLGTRMSDILKTGRKAELALDVLDAEHFDAIKVPTYIAEGLEWLQELLKKRQASMSSAGKSKGAEA